MSDSRPPRRRIRTTVTSLVAAVAVTVSIPVALSLNAPDAAAAPTADWLHVKGNTIVDESGNKVRLTGANFFGFESTERVFSGLWTANLETLTKGMADRGINVVRVPISAELLLEWKAGRATVPTNINTAANPELVGLTTLQVFDRFLVLSEKYGIKVMLDVHSALADNAGHLYPVWYRGSVTAENFYQAWEWVAARYKTNDTVVAMDIKNEPHGKQNESPRAKWDGTTDQDNFKNTCQVAGRRILAINPNVLIMCEGIEIYPRNGTNWSSTNSADYYSTWWGGNLRGVANHPVDLGTNQDQLVYSPHDYGPLVFAQPWFDKPFTKATLTADVWDPNWLYIHKQNIAPLLIGEWGGRLGQDPRQDQWMAALRDTIVENQLSHTFWALNPNSGDTGGLLLDDWRTWDETKYALLKPSLWQVGGSFVSLDHQVRLGGTASTTGKSLGDVYGGGVGGGDTVAPSSPTGLAAGTATSSSIPLAWAASTDNSGGSGVAGYDVYRGATLAGTSTTPRFTVTGLAADTAYSLTVVAKDAAGNRSAPSAAITARTKRAATPAGSCRVAYVPNSWDGGFTATLTLTNTGTAALNPWTLRFSFPSGQTLTQGWSATWSQSGSAVSATGLSWNSSLAPGASTEIGFQGTHSGTNTAPSAFTVNGATCTR